MDIYGYEGILKRAEENIRNASISGNNKKIIFDYERQLFIREFSKARIERCISVLRIISGKLNKDLDSLGKEDIYSFLEWVQRKDIADWTKYTYKQIFKIFLKQTGKSDLGNLIIMKNVKSQIAAVHPRCKQRGMIRTAAKVVRIQKASSVHNLLFLQACLVFRCNSL